MDAARTQGRSSPSVRSGQAEEYLFPHASISIPGLLPTVAYADLSKPSPEQFADLIIEKISGAGSPTTARPREVDPVLEGALADAVLYAEEYLQPQSLDLRPWHSNTPFVCPIFFRVTAPSVHRMVIELEQRGLI